MCQIYYITIVVTIDECCLSVHHYKIKLHCPLKLDMMMDIVQSEARLELTKSFIVVFYLNINN